MSPLRIESPSVPTDAMTALAFVPAGKLTTSVPGSIPSSTLRSVEVEVSWVWVLTSGFVMLEIDAVDGGVVI
jgi:hypothetical protein